MIKHILLIVLLIFVIGKTFGQDFKGIWISKYQRNINRVRKGTDIRDGEFVKIKFDSIVIDTFYLEINTVLDFIDNKNLIVKEFGSEEVYWWYKAKN
jgi:hypothetical protein